MYILCTYKRVFFFSFLSQQLLVNVNSYFIMNGTTEEVAYYQDRLCDTPVSSGALRVQLLYNATTCVDVATHPTKVIASYGVKYFRSTSLPIGKPVADEAKVKI